MKTNCELPWNMFKYNLELNDYDFVLFHLYKSNEKYRQYYKEMRKEHPYRIMIFDNSAYEFFVKGEKLNLDEFNDAINDLKPTYYILPDVLMDKQATLDGTISFLENYSGKCAGEPIAVAQGVTEQELIDCLHKYQELDLGNICIPFHNSFFKTYHHMDAQVLYDFVKEYKLGYVGDLSEDMQYACGRVSFVKRNWFLLKSFDYVHFLGSHCPYEKKFYKEFNSMDTGYPVKLGYEGVLLGREKSKPNVIIDEFFDSYMSPSRCKLIHTNVMTFKNY